MKMKAPPSRSTFNPVSYLSGSKTGYGLNLQAMCDAEYCFGRISVIAPGGADDWSAWTQYVLARELGATFRCAQRITLRGSLDFNALNIA